MIYLIIAIVIIIMLFYLSKQNKENIQSIYKKEIIRILTRQAARWSVAAKQDLSPLIAVLHANYGAAYLWALLDIATPNEIKKASGINVNKFRKHIIDIQDISTKKLTKVCPKFFSDTSYLAKIAGDI